MSETLEDTLAHYGVKGMKWGQTKSKVASAIGKVANSGAPKDPPSADAVKVRALKKTARASTTDALSNQELQDLVTRMNLEQQYNRLRSSDRTSLQRGAAFANDSLSNELVVKQAKSLLEEFPTGRKIAAALDTAVVGAQVVDSLVNKKKKN